MAPGCGVRVLATACAFAGVLGLEEDTVSCDGTGAGVCTASEWLDDLPTLSEPITNDSFVLDVGGVFSTSMRRSLNNASWVIYSYASGRRRQKAPWRGRRNLTVFWLALPGTPQSRGRSARRAFAERVLKRVLGDSDKRRLSLAALITYRGPDEPLEQFQGRRFKRHWGRRAARRALRRASRSIKNGLDPEEAILGVAEGLVRSITGKKGVFAMLRSYSTIAIPAVLLFFCLRGRGGGRRNGRLLSPIDRLRNGFRGVTRAGMRGSSLGGGLATRMAKLERDLVKTDTKKSD